jgi:aminopeptidase 2
MCCERMGSYWRRVVNELKRMFEVYMNTRDESKIPADLFRTAAITVS